MTRVLLNLPSQFAGKYSGVARMAFCLIEHLLHNDEFTYVLRSPWTKAELPKPLNTLRLEVITVSRPRIMVLDVIKQLFSMPLLCRRKNIDLLLNLDPFGAPAGGRARIMVVHDLYFRMLPQQVGLREVFTINLIYRLMLANHDAIVTVSESTRRDLELWYPSAARKIITVHSGLTLSTEAGQSEPLEILGQYVLAVGNPTKNKNFSVLAQAMALVNRSFPDVALVYVGRDPKDAIGSMLSSLNSKVRFIHLSEIDDDRLSSLYRGAACLCVPSLYEGFCFPILEAQALDCPVICSNCSATPEIAGKGAVMFDPKSPQKLAQALATLLSKPNLRDEVIQKGRENLTRFSWEKAARQYEEVFRSALAKQARHGIGAAASTPRVR